MSDKTIYYLEPEFKYNSLIVPFILLVPMLLIILDIIKGNSENFQNIYLENDIIKKYEINATEPNNGDNWYITEYMNDKYNELKNYIKRLSILQNDNGNKSINIRYNIE
jgi:hypothetical protein